MLCWKHILRLGQKSTFEMSISAWLCIGHKFDFARTRTSCRTQRRPDPKLLHTHAKEYPVVPNRAISPVLPFSTTCLCALDFPTLTAIKTKNRERLLSLDEEVRAPVTKFWGYHVCVHLSTPKFRTEWVQVLKLEMRIINNILDVDVQWVSFISLRASWRRKGSQSGSELSGETLGITHNHCKWIRGLTLQRIL